MYNIFLCVNNFAMWTMINIKDLFLLVEDYKNKNFSLNKAFEDFAIKNNRKTDSVRNFYYKQVDFFNKNKIFAQKLNIDLDKHDKKEIKKFSKKEEDKLIGDIDDLVAKGMSVRKACLTISKNDANLMVRLQNKYRNFKRNNIKNNDMQGEIIQFKDYKKNKKLNDDDIKSLFLGLVKLIKNSALDSASEKYEEESFKNRERLTNALIELNKKEVIISELKKQNQILKDTTSKLNEKFFELRKKYEKLKGDLNKI